MAAETTHGPGALSQRVRAAVVEVLREARDAPDEPFDGELGLALTLHAWAQLASRGMQPHAFAIVAYGPHGARYEAVCVDVFEVEAVRLASLDAALDALLATPREVAAALVAVPTRAPAGEQGAPAVRLERELAYVRGLRVNVPPGPFGDGGLGQRIRELEAALRTLGPLPRAMHARVDDGGTRSSHLLLTDARCAGAGCQAAIERRGDVWRLVDGAPPQPVPESFMAVLGGFPWARGRMQGEAGSWR